MLITPPIDEDFWSYRVRVSDTQAVVGFPKFGVVGVGFAIENEDWNTNLPSSIAAEEILGHIAVNKGDDAIPASAVSKPSVSFRRRFPRTRGDRPQRPSSYIGIGLTLKGRARERHECTSNPDGFTPPSQHDPR